MLSQELSPVEAGPAAHSDRKPPPSRWTMSKDMTRYETLGPVPPQHVPLTPLVPQTDQSSEPAAFSSPLIQMNTTMSLHSTT